MIIRKYEAGLRYRGRTTWMQREKRDVEIRWKGNGRTERGERRTRERLCKRERWRELEKGRRAREERDVQRNEG